MNKTITTAIVAILLLVTMIGIRHIDKLNDGIQIKQIQLQDNSAKLKLLDKKYQDLNQELDKTGADKAKVEQQLKDLQIERDSLQAQLQARLDAKRSNIATRAVNTLTGTAVASASGSCPSWIAAAGISDVANANELIRRESGCNPYAMNKSSGACGVAQELPCGKSGCNLGDGACQVRWMNGYVIARYGSWANAVAFHNAHNWY